PARGAEAPRRAARRAHAGGRARAAPRADGRRTDGARRMARRRIVVAGAGAMGASIAYHLALLGAEGGVLWYTGAGASRGAGKAMGGVRQQFSTAPEVRLAQASIELFRELGAPFFHQVGYLFLATTDDGLARLRERAALQHRLGVPVEEVDAAEVR